jgi:hypothetical protein
MLDFSDLPNGGFAQVMPTMGYQRVRDLLIVATGAADLSDSEWNACTRYIHVTQRSDAPFTGILVTTLGGSPNPKQRAGMLEAMAPHPVITCVCTNSVIARGALTAMRWVSTHPMHAFRLGEVDRALDKLGAPSDVRAEAKDVLIQLAAQLPNMRVSVT